LSKWPERITKAVKHLRGTLFHFKGASYGWSGGSLSFYHPVLRFLVDVGAIERVGRTTNISSQLGEEIMKAMNLRGVSRPTNRIVYRLDPSRLDDIGRWASNEPPLVIRQGKLTFDDRFPTPDFRWTECPGGRRR